MAKTIKIRTFYSGFGSEPTKFAYKLLRKFWLRVIITIFILTVVVLAYNLRTSDFSVNEFKPPLTIDKLCKAIVDDNYNISIQAPINTINWLNELLKVPNFYDILHVKKTNINFPQNITNLADKTKDYRNKNFSDLSKDKRNKIKRLNRFLLEETYPQATSKIQDLKNVAFAKAWICVGNLVTLSISGFIVCYITYQVYSNAAQSLSKGFEWIAFGAMIVVFTIAAVGTYFVPHGYLGLLEWSPIALVFGVYRFDRWLIEKNSNHFHKLCKSRDFVMSFDLGILIGLVVTFVISKIMGYVVDENAFVLGFGSGATAFQLIIANLIFDPCLYDFETQDKEVNNK